MGVTVYRAPANSYIKIGWKGIHMDKTRLYLKEKSWKMPAGLLALAAGIGVSYISPIREIYV